MVLGTGSAVKFEKVFSTEFMVKVAKKIFSSSTSNMNQNDFVRWKCWCYLIYVSEFLVVLIFPEIMQIIFATMLVYNEGAACSKYEK